MANPECLQTIDHSNSVSPVNTWLTGLTDNLGVGKLISWQTNDEINVAVHTVTISATNVCQVGAQTYILDVQSACKVQNIDLDVSNLIFTLPALTTSIWEPSQFIMWDDTVVSPQHIDIDCGPYLFELVMKDGTPVDTSVFTLDDPLDTQSLDVFT